MKAIMNSEILYLNLTQVVANSPLPATHWLNSTLSDPSLDYTKEILVHISRGSRNNAISHITLEYKGLKAKFFCCLTFDGSGVHGTGVHNFAMPRMKTSLLQKALACLSVLDFLIAQKHIDADFEYFKEKIISEMEAGSSGVLHQYQTMCEQSRQYIANNTAA